MKYTTHSKEETWKAANDFVTKLNSGNMATVVGLYGNLGAGKTAFTQGLAQALGVLESVASPTFVIEKIYELSNQKFTHLIHIDAYRIEHSDELVHLGWSEIISNPHNLIVVEWPEKVADIMPRHIKVNLQPLNNEESREIEVVF